MRQLLARLVAALLLVAGACTPGDGETANPGESPPETSAATSTTVTSPSRSGEDSLAAPRADAAEKAARYLEDLVRTSDVLTGEEADLEDELAARLALVFDSFSDAHTVASSNGGGVAVALVVPVGPARGDPELIEGLAGVVTGQSFGSPGSVIDIEGRPAISIADAGGAWLLWQNHSIVMIGLGSNPDTLEEEFAAAVRSLSAEYRWEVGDCLYVADNGLPFAPFGDLLLAPCGEPHTHQVIHASVTSEPADAPYPAGFEDFAFTTCEDAFSQHVGIGYWNSQLDMVTYRPDEAEWAAGDRYVSCVIYRADGSGELYELSADMAGTDDATLIQYEIGECYGANRRAGAISCDAAHVFEAVGVVTFDAEAGALLPSRQQRATALTDACKELADAYGSEPPPTGFRVTSVYNLIGSVAWFDDQRDAPCFAAVLDQSDEAVDVIGSLRGSWRVSGRGGVSA